MARASWKYHYFLNEEIDNYIEYLSEENFVNETIPINSRIKTITQLNYFLNVEIYNGKWHIFKKLSKHYFGYKLGNFTKNRKPYYFRSKKKKNVTKKHKLPNN